MSNLVNISMAIVNWPDFAKGLVDADKRSLQFMRQELSRSLKRLRKRFINEQLKGPPGIKATGRLSKGKNVFTYVKGSTHKDLEGFIGISRLLNIHEKGATIVPRQTGERLYIKRRGKGAPMGGTIVATAKQIVIPKRLHFQTLVATESPAILVRVGQAGERGVQVALTQALKKTVKKI